MTHQPISGPTDHLFAIIVAGGSGSRMQSSVPKQFLVLGNKPILQHTVERFLTVLPAEQIFLVLPAAEQITWAGLCGQYGFHPPVHLIDGAATRFQSVRAGLAAIQATTGIVAVHDGVRPFVSSAIIGNSFQTAAQTGSAVTCVPVKDSVRVVGPNGSQAVDRSQYRLVQTPQTFELNAFRRAFQAEEQPFFTDCASVMEHAGYPITLIDGAYENIKITTPVDLKWGLV